jgi:hypothetical protein
MSDPRDFLVYAALGSALTTEAAASRKLLRKHYR